MRLQVSLVALLVTACGATSASTAPPSASHEPDRCTSERVAILDAMAASRAASICATATDCAIVTGPGSPSPEHHEVVAAADAAALDARADAHLELCGLFHHDAPIDAYREVAAACVDGRCAIEETMVHVPPLDE